MNLEVLSSSECRSLCREAAILVLDRFRWLRERSGSADRPLTVLFGDLAADAERNLTEIRHLENLGWTPEPQDAEPVQQVARGFLPSLSKTTGGDRLDRESGFYLAECLLEDLADFYGALVRHTGDEPSKDLLHRSKRAAESRLEFLRQVIL